MTIPAGTLENPRDRLFKFRDSTGTQLDGLRNLTLRTRSNGEGTLSFVTVPLDLSNAAAEDQDVTVQVSAGTWNAQHKRRWQFRSGRLRPRP